MEELQELELSFFLKLPSLEVDTPHLRAFLILTSKEEKKLWNTNNQQGKGHIDGRPGVSGVPGR